MHTGIQQIWNAEVFPMEFISCSEIPKRLLEKLFVNFNEDIKNIIQLE